MADRSRTLPACDPRLLRMVDAAQYCGVSVSFWAGLVKREAVPNPVCIDGRVKVWDRRALDKWIDSMGQPVADGFAGVE